MKIILLFLAALASFTVHAQPPSQTVEQTVRHIYQNYKSDATAPYFGETGERVDWPPESPDNQYHLNK